MSESTAMKFVSRLIVGALGTLLCSAAFAQQPQPVGPYRGTL
jgi:hypothetical protein